ARAFSASLEAQFGADWLSTHVIDLFNSGESAEDQVQRLREFLQANRENATKLILYYVGHGGFFADREYFLALRTTEKDKEYFTGLNLRVLADVVGKTFAHGQVYIVLDCCFAGEATRHFESDEVARLVETKTFQAFPAAGTTLLCASSKDEVAISKGRADCTQFSECLTDVLLNGVDDGGELLSLREVGVATKNRIKSRFGLEAVHPEVQSPRQSEGEDPADQPLFRNLAWQGKLERLRPDLAKRLRSEDRIERLGIVAELKRMLIGDDQTFRGIVRAALVERLDEEHGERDFAVREAILDAVGTDAREPEQSVTKGINLGRRRFLISGVIGLSGIAGSVYYIWRHILIQPTSSLEDELRTLEAKYGQKQSFRHKYRIMTPGHDSGFYVHIRSKVLHYVTRDGFIRHCDPDLLVSHLRSAGSAVENILEAGGRQNLVYASVSTEEAALTSVASEAYDEACLLLLMGIWDDWTFKRKVGRSPSVRLYDLLAAISVRHDKDTYLQEMIDFLRTTRQERIFANRIKKWSEPGSNWNRRWRDRSHRRRWRWSVGYGTYKEVWI
ncbi:MAG: hypothetical protein V3R26_05420, partial [Hyphomicrobium sp.]